MSNYQPRDLLAALIIISYLVFAYFTGMTMLPSALMLIIGYYFARRDDLNKTNQ